MRHIYIFIILTFTSVHSYAESDPVAEREARNAALEKVSPVMTRELAYQLTPNEQLHQNINDLQSLLTSINGALANLTMVGERAPQAKLLMSLDKSSRDTLIALLESEAKRLKDTKPAVAEPSSMAAPLKKPQIAAAPKAPVIKRQPKAVERYEKIIPIVVREYDEPNRSTKVILKVGSAEPAVFYVGDSFQANGESYTIESALPIRISSAPHARPVYAIKLRSSAGTIQEINWE